MGDEGLGSGGDGQTMYTHVSKCKHDKIKKVFFLKKAKLKFDHLQEEKGTTTIFRVICKFKTFSYNFLFNF
jgi:hypothetical protein